MHLAVIDPLPMYRQGVVAVLSAAGHQVEVPPDPMKWAQSRPADLVLITLASIEDWDLLSQLRETAPEQHVIAVMTEASAEVGVRAVRAGAQSVLHREVTADALQRTVEATIDGQTVLPVAVAAMLAGGAVDGVTRQAITKVELTWLRHLAAGMTVAELARLAGYSERAMFRLLQGVYRQLGARSRIEAIIRAQEQGWLRTS
ncbi:DNA-binding response regulator [Micromonospora sp. WMMD967]|uniref:DNA-binding response regulator n=1 Tax=Micromonospora sp. WMMD967 TaxID=3016101 RepID=UPI002417B86F|nr:DNA-binding response regulator [Micromonospora sp. WMMD967]MDG4839843.1 DNA-binding response regulator [Micromonospora sp. WMMD967]